MKQIKTKSTVQAGGTREWGEKAHDVAGWEPLGGEFAGLTTSQTGCSVLPA